LQNAIFQGAIGSASCWERIGKEEKVMALLGRFFAVSLDIFWKNIACTESVDYLLKHTAQ
jgi:hypothetical protein